MKMDLHCHSNFSMDSHETVASLLQRAKDAGLGVFAIADHNAIEGSLEAQKDTTLTVLSGIEIDCHFQDTVVHLLGYGCDLNNPWIQGVCARYPEELRKVARETIRLLEAHYGFSFDEATLLARGQGTYGHVEIISELLEKGSHPELEPYQTGSRKENPIANFYWDNCSSGKWAYIKMDLPTAQEVIQGLHRAHGVAICAHPLITIGKKEEAMQELLQEGIDGFEAYSSYHQPEDCSFYASYCEKRNLVITCGSDFHGPVKPSVHFGEHGYEGDCTPFYETLRRRIQDYE